MKFSEIVSFSVDVSYNHSVNETYESGNSKFIIRLTYNPLTDPNEIRKTIKLELEKYLWSKTLIGVKDVIYTITSPISKISPLDTLLFNQNNYDIDIVMEQETDSLSALSALTSKTSNSSKSSLASNVSSSTIASNVSELLKSPEITKCIIVKEKDSEVKHLPDYSYETLSEAGTFIESYKPQTQPRKKHFDIQLNNLNNNNNSYVAVKRLINSQ